jgi:ParB family chromosome partitioning protein
MMADKPQRRALGRGLDALLPPKAAAPASDGAYGPRAVFECGVERIVPRRDQPRKKFDDDKLAELAATIAEHGIIQPLVVRRLGDQKFEIIAGERRWRAAQRAGKKEVPVVVKDVSPATAFELALVENLQREDLNPLEVAEGYARLCHDSGLTQEQIAERVGKSRVAVTNSMRLLKLPEPVRAMLSTGELSEGHARTLLGASDEATMVKLARKAVAGRLTVRALEQLIKGRKPSDGTTAEPQKTSNVRDLEHRITRRLGARTSIDHHGPGGKITVSYGTLDDLDRLIAVLGA